MARLDEYIFGYHKGKVAPEDNARVLNALLKLGICSRVSSDGSFVLRAKDKGEFCSYAASRMRFELSEPLGLFGALHRLRYRWGVLIAVVLLSLIFVFSCGRVWDVRIDGNEGISDFDMEKILSAHGLSVGMRWRGLDVERLEADILLTDADIAWISVTRRGTVAYVQVIESENVIAKGEAGAHFCNVVADRDGVITEITVESGVPAVKVGDVVRKGDILISGVVENERGVTLCRAEGVVIADSVTELSGEAAELGVIKRLKKHRIAELRVVIFNFSINIFKNYGNYANTCDIIEENRRIALFNRVRLPLRIEKRYIAEYEEEKYTRSRDEMESAAKRELDGRIHSVFKNADIVRIRTAAEIKDGVYRITARVVYSADIGKESAIEVN